MVERGLVPTRAKAQELIKAGFVRVNGKTAAKPANEFPTECTIELTGETHPFVGRGGMKLDHALKTFQVNVAGATCLDLGASTGGFTDVLLRGGATKVYAVDVGHDQLHPALREDPRVVNLEGLHAKDLSAAQVDEPVGVITVDVSFISIIKALPFALALAAESCQLIALVKPQFEVGRGNLGKGGIVRDEALRQQVLADVCTFIESTPGWRVLSRIDSPIAGGDGNAEFLLHAVKG